MCLRYEVLLVMTRGHVQGSVLNFACFILFISDICLQMSDRFIAVGYGQVKGSIIYKRETVLTVDRVT